MLPRQHRPFALDTPVVTAEVSVAPQDAVAGNQPGDGIGADRLPDRAARARAADRFRHGPIARRPARAQVEQRLPDLDLEVRAHRRKDDPPFAVVEDLPRNPGDGGVVARQRRARPAAGERRDRALVGTVHECEPGEPARRSRGVDAAEW
jgi:hypothetical protein